MRTLPALALAVLAPLQAEEPRAFAFDEFLLVPLRVHLLESKTTPALHTTLTDADIERVLGKVNRVWAQAGIHFARESLLREPAHGDPPAEIPRDELRWLVGHIPPASRAPAMLHVYYVKRFAVNGVIFPEGIFVKDTASLRPVEGGIDEPLPRVTSHELGHALSLPHRQDITNLMASGTTGTSLNAAEVAQARDAAKKFAWVRSAGELLREADALHDAGKPGEARPIYARLALLPLDCEAVRRANVRAGE